MARPREDLAARLRSKIVEGDGCWQWTGVTNHGRPVIKVEGRNYPAVKVAWALEQQLDLAGDWTATSCPASPLCVRVEHLDGPGSKRSANRATSRRQRGEGHVRELGPDRHQVIVSAGGGKQRTKVVRGDIAMAERELARLAGGQVQHRKLVAAGAPDTLAKLIDHYIEQRVAVGKLSPSTARTYRFDVKRIPQPDLDTAVPLLTAGQLDRIYADMLARGLAPKSVTNVERIVNAVLAYAYRKDWVDRNVNDKTEPIEGANDDGRPIPAPVVVRAILAAAEADDLGFACLICISASTGMRRGELAGLRWADVDLDELVIDVRRAVALRDGDIAKGEPKRMWYLKEPKSGSFGKVTIDAVTAERLRAHRVAMAQRALMFGCGLADDAYVFSDREDCSEWLVPTTITNRFAALVDKADAGDVILKDLRAWVSSTIQSKGMGEAAAQQRLRHRPGSTTTRKHYTRPVSGAEREAADVVAAVLYGSS